MIDEGQDVYILATNMGFLGFAAIQSTKSLWQKTGEHFQGVSDDLEAREKKATGFCDIKEVDGLEEALKNHPDCTGVFPQDSSISATYFRPPQGPNGYRSDYLIRVISGRLFDLVIVYNGNSKRLQVDSANIINAVQGAQKFLKTQKGNPKREKG